MKCFIFHKWGEWGDAVVWRGIAYNAVFNEKMNIIEDRQRRKCQRCGKLEERRVK